MANTYWNIDNGNGSSLSQGIQSEIVARRAAQCFANKLGHSVFLYEAGASHEASDSDDSIEFEEIKPESAE